MKFLAEIKDPNY